MLAEEESKHAAASSLVTQLEGDLGILLVAEKRQAEAVTHLRKALQGYGGLEGAERERTRHRRLCVLEALSEALAAQGLWREGKEAGEEGCRLAMELELRGRAASMLVSCGHMETRIGGPASFGRVTRQWGKAAKIWQEEGHLVKAAKTHLEIADICAQVHPPGGTDG